MHDDAGARTALAAAPARVLGSDPHDFAGLYIRHRCSFISHARRYLRDPRDADEVVQEAFLRLFLAMPELESELQALAYCRRTITNLCIDRYRADARRPRLVALDGAPVDELAEDDAGDPVVRAEDAALVREALSQLPELHRAALVMREIEEKPLPVIAEELDVAEDSVKHLLYRARRHLRKLLAGTSVAPGVDLELTRGLRPVARGGVAGLLLLALLGLGSGPDLRAVPVVGVDLPDVLGVTAVVDAVRDVVAVAVPAVRPGDAAAAAPGNGPVRRTQDVPLSSSSAGDQSAAAAGAPASDRAAPPRTAGTGRSTTVVTVVDGRPVVSVVPVPAVSVPVAPGSVDLAAAPRTAVPPTAPGTSTGLGGSPYLPAPVTSAPTVVRDLPVWTPAGTVAPPAAAPGRPVDAPGRPTRADAVPPRSGGAAAPPADRPVEVAQKVADKAAAAADRAQDKAERAAERAEQVTARADDKAMDKAEQAADRADKDRAEKAGKAERAVAKADKAAERAEAQQASAQAAEAAAAQAAAAAAAAAGSQAVAAAPVAAVTTTVAPPPAP